VPVLWKCFKRWHDRWFGKVFALGAGLTLAPFLFGNEEEKQQPMYQGADIADPRLYYGKLL
jgi:hypothetical protein